MVTTHKKICTEYTQNKKRKESKYITTKKKNSEIQRKIEVRRKDQKDYNRQKTFNKWQ